MNSVQARIRTIGLLGLAILGVALLHSISAEEKALPASAAVPECQDGKDNDNDGDIDFPEDRNCDSSTDNYEGPQTSGLVLSVTDKKDKVEAGGNLVYTINLTTTHAHLNDIDVRFYLPEYANLVSASANGHVHGGVVDWRFISVDPTRSTQLFVTLEIEDGAKTGDIIVAEVRAAGEVAKDSTTIHTETIPLSNKIKLSVTDGLVYADPEEVLVYRILVTNREHVKQTVNVRSQIPAQFVLHEITGEHRKNGREIEWNNLKLEPKEVRELIVTGHVERDVPDHYSLVYKVTSGTQIAKDTTTIGTQKVIARDLEVSLTDNYKTTTNGQLLTYEALLRNHTNTLMTNVSAKANLPQYTEFVDAKEGGYWTGSSIMWKNLTVSPNGQRVLHYTLRVRSDAPLGSSIRAGISAKGHEAYDITDVSTRRSGNPIAIERRPLLSKVADRTEVRPGDTVAFTLSLRNTTDAPFYDVTVEDKFNGKGLRVVPGTEAGGITSKGKTIWNVPVLQPGEEWTVQYRMQVHPQAPHGTYFTNVVSANGKGLESIALTDRVRTSRIGVVTQLPKSGVSLDLLFLLTTGLLGAAPAGLGVRRKIFV